MAYSIAEFHQDLLQDVSGTAHAEERFSEDAFFDIFCAYLIEAGELETADRAFFQSPRGSRIDGYGGDPTESGGVLSLIISDFRQSASVESLTATDLAAILKRATNFLKKALDPDFRVALEETSSGFGLADLIATRWPQIAKVRIHLISCRQLSDRIEGHGDAVVDGVPVTYNVWDLGRVYRYVSAKKAREDIEIDFVRDFGKALPVLPAHLDEAGYEAYLAVIPGEQLAAIYDRWGARLLEQNVRVFLQARGNVNKGIRATIENVPHMFFAYNNGITATAEGVELHRSDGETAITKIRNLQIVNGGQTTASVHAAKRRKDDLSKIFVQLKLSVIDEAMVAVVVPRISEFANSQNRVNAADFFANHAFHVRIEGASRRIYAPSADGTFRQSKWFYERARGQYQDARGDLTAAQRRRFDEEYPKRQMITKTDLAKYLVSWGGRPDIVSTGAQKNFAAFAEQIGKEWDKDAEAFNDRYYQHAIAKAIMFKCTEKLISGQDWYEGGYRANIVTYAIAKLGHHVTSAGYIYDFDSVWRRQAIAPSTERALIAAARAVASVLMAPPSGMINVSEWAKKKSCWDRVKEIEMRWPAELSNDLQSEEVHRTKAKAAKKEQKAWTEVEALTAVGAKDATFWQAVLKWGGDQRVLSDEETSFLSVAAGMPKRIPSAKQSLRIVEILERLGKLGCPLSLGD